MLEILLIFSPDDWFEEVIDNSDKAGWMDNKASFEIFLVSPVNHLVETPEPGERRLVRGGQTVVEVDKTVVDINILVQCQHQVPGSKLSQSPQYYSLGNSPQEALVVKSLV